MYEELERVYQAILDALRAGKPAAVATVVEVDGSAPRGAGAKMLIMADGTTVGTVGGGGVEARSLKRPGPPSPRAVPGRSSTGCGTRRAVTRVSAAGTCAS